MKKTVGDKEVFVPDLRLENDIEQTSGVHSPILGWSYDGSPIYGSCETTSFGIFTEELCVSNNGVWTPYLNEYNINDFKIWNSEDTAGGCRLAFSEKCIIEDFGNSFCSQIDNENLCNQEQGCDWSELKLVYSESGSLSPESFYQNHFVFYENNFPQYDYWSLDPDKFITTDAIDGLVFTIKNVENGSFLSESWLNTGSVSSADNPLISIKDRQFETRRRGIIEAKFEIYH